MQPEKNQYSTQITEIQNFQEEENESEMSLTQQAVMNQILLSSLEPTRKQKGYLPTKYRKMIPNMKMKRSSQKCTLCLNSYAENQIIKKFPCGHIMHRMCAKEWLKKAKTCPICVLDLQQYYINLETQMINSQEKGKKVESVSPEAES